MGADNRTGCYLPGPSKRCDIGARPSATPLFLKLRSNIPGWLSSYSRCDESYRPPGHRLTGRFPSLRPERPERENKVMGPSLASSQWTALHNITAHGMCVDTYQMHRVQQSLLSWDDSREMLR